jgi:hypothetical protein
MTMIQGSKANPSMTLTQSLQVPQKSYAANPITREANSAASIQWKKAKGGEKLDTSESN